MADKKADAAHGDVQEQIDDENEQGFRGEKTDPLPDSAYTLQSGPDSPPAVPDDNTRAGVPAPGKDK